MELKRKNPRGAPRIPIATQEAIEGFALEGHGPTAIQQKLELLINDGKLKKLPDLKTIRKYAHLTETPDQSGPWSLANNGGSDPGPVLDALADVISVTGGRVTTITNKEGALITTIRGARPDLRPFESWRLARVYLARELRGEPADDLDAAMAFAPWRGEEERERYEQAWRSGWIAPVPRFILDSLSGGEPRHAETPAPEALDEMISGHNRRLTPMRRAIREGSKLVMSAGDEGYAEDVEWEARIERHNERVRADDAALPEDQRLRETYEEDEEP